MPQEFTILVDQWTPLTKNPIPSGLKVPLAKVVPRAARPTLGFNVKCPYPNELPWLQKAPQRTPNSEALGFTISTLNPKSPNPKYPKYPKYSKPNPNILQSEPLIHCPSSTRPRSLAEAGNVALCRPSFGF